MSPVYSEPIGFSFRAQPTGLLLPAISSERHTKKVSREISCLLFQGQLSRPKKKHKISAPDSHLPSKASSTLSYSKMSEGFSRTEWGLQRTLTGKPVHVVKYHCSSATESSPAQNNQPWQWSAALCSAYRQNKGLGMRRSRLSCKGQHQRQILPWHFRSAAQPVTKGGDNSRIFHCTSKNAL